MLDFFSLGETFLGIGMRLGGGIMQFKMFGNTLYILAHPIVTLFLSTLTLDNKLKWKKTAIWNFFNQNFTWVL